MEKMVGEERTIDRCCLQNHPDRHNQASHHDTHLPAEAIIHPYRRQQRRVNMQESTNFSVHGTIGMAKTAPIENAAVITPSNAPLGLSKSARRDIH
jgi:hypothetical protein